MVYGDVKMIVPSSWERQKHLLLSKQHNDFSIIELVTWLQLHPIITYRL